MVKNTHPNLKRCINSVIISDISNALFNFVIGDELYHKKECQRIVLNTMHCRGLLKFGVY